MYVSKKDPNVKFETKEEVIEYVSKNVPTKSLLPYFDVEDGLNIIKDLAKKHTDLLRFKDCYEDTLEKYVKENFERTVLRLSFADFIKKSRMSKDDLMEVLAEGVACDLCPFCSEGCRFSSYDECKNTLNKYIKWEEFSE